MIVIDLVMPEWRSWRGVSHLAWLSGPERVWRTYCGRAFLAHPKRLPFERCAACQRARAIEEQGK